MKSHSVLFVASLVLVAPLGHAQNDGSNVSGSEKVCEIDTRSDAAFENALKKCNRGDIVPLENLSHSGLMQVCDFTKSIVTVDKYSVGCVYTGKRRKVGE